MSLVLTCPYISTAGAVSVLRGFEDQTLVVGTFRHGLSSVKVTMPPRGAS
jgi:hypothetical protein